MSKQVFSGADFFQYFLQHSAIDDPESYVRLVLYFNATADEINNLSKEIAQKLAFLNQLTIEKSIGNKFYFAQNLLSVQRVYNINVQLDKKCIQLSFQHQYFDYAGIAKILDFLNGQEIQPTLHSYQPKFPNRILSLIQGTILSLKPKAGKMYFAQKIKDNYQAHFFDLCFDEDQSRQLQNLIIGYHLQFNPSIYLNACLALAYFKTFNCQDHYLYVPNPVNCRKKDSPVVGNQLEFLFYRIDFNKDKSLLINELIKQVKNQVKNKQPQLMNRIFSGMMRLPFFLSKAMIQLPQQGNYCTYTYSDLGFKLNSFNKLGNLEINHIKNYPTLPENPGLVFVSEWFQNRFSLRIAFNEGRYKANDIKNLIENIKTELLHASL